MLLFLISVVMCDGLACHISCSAREEKPSAPSGSCLVGGESVRKGEREKMEEVEKGTEGEREGGRIRGIE